MLEIEGKWRFDSPCAMQLHVVGKFRELIDRISTIDGNWQTLEHFKKCFASKVGQAYARSSNEGWALSDLADLMSAAAENAPLFIETFHEACEELQTVYPQTEMPGIFRINRILAEHDVGFQIDPPRLIATKEHIFIAVPEEVSSLDNRVKEAVQESLAASERSLGEGNGRQAVQEALWLLESISTAFQSAEILDGDIKGHYFNKIIPELRRHRKGPQEQILNWMKALHGYLSSPTGGGIRHGANLLNLPDLGISEARLYCNLIKSYSTYLIEEYERLRQSSL